MSEYFTVGKQNGHWWFFTPEKKPFFSIGMNHIDSAALRYPESGNIWQTKYQNSEQQWIQQGVVPDLNAWGFNSIGWTQEVVVRGESMHRHSRSFTYEEYQWSAMPYCHLLPFTETHQWDRETSYPDVFSREFEEWCDFVARKDCVQMANDPNLIGYFYVDCPSWVHCQKGNPKGPWFDPARLDTTSGRKELGKMATQYYRITHDAIRRYDPNHLILGDRYEGRSALPDEILEAAVPYVDVLSFQYFSRAEEICPDFERWHTLTGLPVLLADAAPPRRQPGAYEPMIRGLREHSSCIGWHVCGAYVRNRCRGAGFRDEQENQIKPLVSEATQANHQTLNWVDQIAKNQE